MASPKKLCLCIWLVLLNDLTCLLQACPSLPKVLNIYYDQKIMETKIHCTHLNTMPATRVQAFYDRKEGLLYGSCVWCKEFRKERLSTNFSLFVATVYSQHLDSTFPKDYLLILQLIVSNLTIIIRIDHNYSSDTSSL